MKKGVTYSEITDENYWKLNLGTLYVFVHEGCFPTVLITRILLEEVRVFNTYFQLERIFSSDLIPWHHLFSLLTIVLW